MKRKCISLCFLVALVCICGFSGCTKDPTEIHQTEPKAVEQVGQIPDTFKAVVENNLFYDITAFDGRLLKAEASSHDKENRTVTYRVQMMDVYGKELAAYLCSCDDAYHVCTLTATADGGFLFVLGFSDYAYDQGFWASDKGFASRVIKVDKYGQLQFDTPFDSVEGSALSFCFEKDGKFYFFGSQQTPETNTQGVYSKTDVYMAVLDQNGAILQVQCVAGSDFDSLEMAEMVDGVFVLSIRAQSDDGDFAGSDSGGYPVDWVFSVDENLEIRDKKKESGRDYFDRRIGERGNTPIYQSDPLLKDFDAGTVTALIDYGDSYLIVSENNTGEYEHTPPTVSSIWYYTETVYSLYDTDGNMLFRASVDSSPDFDVWAEGFFVGKDSAT